MQNRKKLLNELETVFDHVNLFLPTFPHPSMAKSFHETEGA